MIYKKKKYAVNFDVNYYIEVNATNEYDAMEKAQHLQDKAMEVEIHNQSATLIKKKRRVRV